MDVWSVNLRRMHPWQDNDRYLQDRTVESLGIGYQDHWPFRQSATARGVKKSVLHDRLAAAGACFGESAGWERPNWYARPGSSPPTNTAGDGKTGLPTMREEHAAVRERVGVFEQSSFAKLLVQGARRGERAEPHRHRQRRRRRRPLRVHPVSQCRRGGIEADLTITRLAADRFLVVTAAFTQTHVEAWIRNQTPAGRIVCRDATCPTRMPC